MVRFATLLAVLGLWAIPALAEPSGTVRVIDADTFDIGDTRVRLHGIDAPERDQTCHTEHGLPFACGAWVTEQVIAMYEGQTAQCTAIAIDRYRRVVASCEVAGHDMGATIVAAGLAFAFRRFSDDYVPAERIAARADRGLWSLNVTTPSWFRQTRAVGRIPLDPDCRIKGNISSKGTRIFHVPGQKFYERTGIRPEKGEVWFCSEIQALSAGWRASKL